MQKPPRFPSSSTVYAVFAALAIVNVMTAGLIAFVASVSIRDHRAALENSRQTARRLAALEDLRRASRALNAPGNNVFISRSPHLERQRMEHAALVFEGHSVRVLETLAGQGTLETTLRADVGVVRANANAMIRLSRRIFDEADRNAYDDASRHMAAMDHEFLRATTRMSAMASRLHEQQFLAHEAESAQVEKVSRGHRLAAGFIAVFVLVAAAYGLRVLRALPSLRRQERLVVALQEREQELEAAIAERDTHQRMLDQRNGLLVEAEKLAALGHWSWDVATNHVTWSEELCRIFALPHGAPTYESYVASVHPADRERVVAAIGTAFTTGEDYGYDHRIVRPNGEIRVLRSKGKVETDPAGRPTRMFGVSWDITEQQQIIDELRRKESQLEEAQRIAHLGSWEWNAITGQTDWSEEMRRIVGAGEDVVPSYESYCSFIDPRDRDEFIGSQQDAIAARRQRADYEHRLVHEDGSTAHVIFHSRMTYDEASGVLQRAVGTVQDVTERKAAEESLRLSQERFEIAALATNDIIWDWSCKDDTLWYSDAFSIRFGHPASGAVAPSLWQEMIHPDDCERVLARLAEAISDRDRQFWSDEYRFRTHAGEWREVYDRGYILRDGDGAASRFIGAMMDVTAQKRAAEELVHLGQQKKLILDSTADGIFGVDAHGKVNFINAAAASILGWERDEILGHDVHRLFPGAALDVSSAEASLLEVTLVTGEAQSGTEVFWRKDGTSVPVDWNANAMRGEDQEIIGAVVTFRDITGRLAVDRMKDEFVSTVSHELRTPLTAMRGALGILSTGRLGEFSEKAQRMLDIALGNTDRLVKLINDVLDIERMASGSITLTRGACRPDGLVAQAIEGVRPLLDRAQITMTVDVTSEPIHADADRVMQTLTNLLSNAIKFSPAGTNIHIATEWKNGDIIFSVRDQGRGIPAHKLELVFKRFEQVDASDSRDKGGSGLGLAICRSIVEQHGGRIWVDSELGHGSTFSFSIPSGRPSAVFAATGEVRPSIFVCDDDDLSREAMRTFLDGQGYDIRDFASGRELMEALGTEQPAAILLDIFMDDMNGFEVLARIKSNPLTASIPIVIVTVLSEDECMSLEGVSAWLQKPLMEEGIHNALRTAFSSGRRPRVLLIEDDADLAKTMLASLERYNAHFVHASTGREAIELARQFRPDLLILDLILPDVDGFTIVDWLKDRDLCRAVPLIVYSALETSPAEQERLRLGPSQFLTKGRVTPEEFERRIGALLDSITRTHEKEMTDVA